MSDVCPVETVDDEGFAAAAPCKIEVLLRSVVWGAAAEGVDDIEEAREAKGVVEERALEGIAILDGAICAERGMKEVFVFVIW
jgi:hypothetical protein